MHTCYLAFEWSNNYVQMLIVTSSDENTQGVTLHSQGASNILNYVKHPWEENKNSYKSK